MSREAQQILENTIHPNRTKLACNGKTIRQSVLKKKYLDEK
jgi:hypothetical protein